jgi:hypothetical protein
MLMCVITLYTGTAIDNTIDCATHNATKIECHALDKCCHRSIRARCH